ncbi:helix-turn-helix transcriptional regulator [Bacillus paralicheniformis]|uniref:helix-turn-helix transcriptional regulator n=1 Tax=Bacillus paralicheniformis TaxID=1648923 RepID=UPI003BFA1003
MFKRFTGKTFNDYLIDLRVRKAVDCLLESDMSITEICFGVGFNDLAYFSRIGFPAAVGADAHCIDAATSHWRAYAADDRLVA